MKPHRGSWRRRGFSVRRRRRPRRVFPSDLPPRPTAGRIEAAGGVVISSRRVSYERRGARGGSPCVPWCFCKQLGDAHTTNDCTVFRFSLAPCLSFPPLPSLCLSCSTADAATRPQTHMNFNHKNISLTSRGLHAGTTIRVPSYPRFIIT